ncbi:MAG: SGNH/GDSL hydrolase family protein [Flavisolibacter sp.]
MEEVKMNLQSGLTILFQGDSISDAGRKRNNCKVLGEGYVMMIAAWISAAHPEIGAKFINLGISGNRIGDLRNRWKKDCLDLKPNIVSILIGINDALGKPFWGEPTPLESFQSDYEYVLEQSRFNPEIQIVLIEPFLLPSNPNYKEIMYNLTPKIEFVKDLSKQFKTVLIPMNDIFTKAAGVNNPCYWSLDGVHPTLAGHALIAQSWIKGVIACGGIL